MKITIIGGGNLGTLMGAMFAHKRNEVTIHTSKPEKYEKKIEVYNNNEEFLYSGILSNVTNNWKEAIEEAELIWITVPPQLFFDTAKLIEPYIKQGQMIGLVPGAGAAEFAFAPLIEKGVKFFGLARVPSIARLKEYGKSVYMLGPAPELLVGSIPANNSKEICTAIQPLFDMVCRPLANYGDMKVTEVNIRHMAYTGVMAHVGFDLIEDTIKIMEDGNADRVERNQYHHYDKPYIFLRDVDVEPIILDSEEIFDDVISIV